MPASLSFRGAAQAASPEWRRANSSMLHRSREANAPPSFAVSLTTHSEGAERRQALGCSGTRRRANDVGPQALRAPASHDAGCSPLGAPPRRLLAPGPPWRNRRALHMSGALRSRIGAFARSARSGGRAVLPGASRGRGYEPRAQDAASRSDSGSSPETPLVSGTARTIVSWI